MKTVPCTVSTLAAASQEISPTGLFAGPMRHEYDDAGVRLKAVVTLRFRVGVGSLSNTGGVPPDTAQPWKAPGAALRNHQSQAGVRGVSVGTTASLTLAQTLSALEHGLCCGLLR